MLGHEAGTSCNLEPHLKILGINGIKEYIRIHGHSHSKLCNIRRSRISEIYPRYAQTDCRIAKVLLPWTLRGRRKFKAHMDTRRIYCTELLKMSILIQIHTSERICLYSERELIAFGILIAGILRKKSGRRDQDCQY